MRRQGPEIYWERGPPSIEGTSGIHQGDILVPSTREGTEVKELAAVGKNEG
jgi:hypothetical protein